MRQLSKLQTAIFFIGGILLMVGAAAYLLEPFILAPSIFTTGAIFYVIIQWMQSYLGDDPTIKRLRKIQIVSGILILIAALLMISNRWVYDIYRFTKIDIFNTWIAFLLAGAILQVYTIFRIDNELKKTI